MRLTQTRARATVIAAVTLTAAAVAAPAAAQATRGHTTVTASAPFVTITGGPVVPGGLYRLTIDRDGRATFSQGRRRRTLTVSVATMTTLRHDLATARFAHLKRDYVRHGHPLVGAYPERVTYAGRTVTVAPGATAPTGLRRVITALTAIVSREE